MHSICEYYLRIAKYIDRVIKFSGFRYLYCRNENIFERFKEILKIFRKISKKIFKNFKKLLRKRLQKFWRKFVSLEKPEIFTKFLSNFAPNLKMSQNFFQPSYHDFSKIHLISKYLTQIFIHEFPPTNFFYFVHISQHSFCIVSKSF